MIVDGGSPRPLDDPNDAICAGWVDNSCAVSKNSEIATSRARAVADLLTSRGATCIGVLGGCLQGGLHGAADRRAIWH
eukprot:6343278-Pyramimonas_sp.AAC.1